MDQTAVNKPPRSLDATVAFPNSHEMASLRIVEELFHRCLQDHLHEGVIFVDPHLRITMWNRATEQVTGMRAPAMLNQRWLPSRVELKDRFGAPIEDCKCPVAEAIRKGEQRLVAACVTGRGGRQIAIDLHAVPVLGNDGSVFGATVFLRDQSSQVDLEQQVLTLYANATRDQLTGVANRAHFERSLEVRVQEFEQKSEIFSLIVTDIDFFKKINDDFGHHVGDQALMGFAKLLQQNTRVEDLVARYGGEEFVIVCPQCDLDTAVRRAEELRTIVESTPFAVTNGSRLTASFGVSQVDHGDTPTELFIRADKALLNAKEAGRNRVAYLKAAPKQRTQTAVIQPRADELNWRPSHGDVLRTDQWASSSTMELLVEKIKGFLLDINASIISAEPDFLQIKVSQVPGTAMRRFADRPIPLLVDLEFRAYQSRDQESFEQRNRKTQVRVSVRTYRGRDRRRKDIGFRIERLLGEIRSYLMVGESEKRNR